MLLLSVFPDITKIGDFWWEIADVSRIQEIRHVIHAFLDFFQVRYNFAKFHHCSVCPKKFR